MFYSLKKSGKLAGLKGVLIGGLTAIKDSEIPFGKTVEEVIHEHVSSLSIPVAFNFPAGHIDDNRAIVIGKPAKMDTTIEGTLFLQ
jgi:muramoyltetrapeptide carboxypeptidase